MVILKRLTGPAALLVVCWIGVQAAAATALDPVLAGLEWGESADALKHHFGKSAITLSPPIEFGDAYADVALRGVMLGGYDYVVYFEMDKASHGLKRVMYERPRHGANRAVFDAAVQAIAAQLGPPKSCAAKARSGNGYQAMRSDVWHSGGRRVQAIFRDTTLAAENGCQEIGALPCGLEEHLFILVDPSTAPEPDCR